MTRPVHALGRIEGSPAIAFVETGAGAPIIFLHGVGGNKSNWDAQLEATSRTGFRAIACDVRGYGDSDDYEGPFRLDDAVSDLLRLLDHLHTDAAHFVGLSMGGSIALALLEKFPERARSVIAASINAGLGTVAAEVRAAFLERRLAPLEAGRAIHDVVDEIAASLLGPSASAEHYAILRDSISALRARSYMKALRAVADICIDVRALDSGVPLLFLAADRDRLIQPATVAATARMAPGASFAVLPEAGHLSNIEQPDAFNQAIEVFIGNAQRAWDRRAAARCIQSHIAGT